MARGVDDQQAGQQDLEGLQGLHALGLYGQSLAGELSGSDLLRDAACFTFLHIRVADLIQQLGLASVHVSLRYRKS